MILWTWHARQGLKRRLAGGWTSLMALSIKVPIENTLNCRRWCWDGRNFKYFIVIQLVISEWTMICPRDISNITLLEERILWLCYVLWLAFCCGIAGVGTSMILSHTDCCHAADDWVDKKIWNWVDFTARWANCRATNCWDKVTAILFTPPECRRRAHSQYAVAHLDSKRCRFSLLTITMNNPSLP